MAQFDPSFDYLALLDVEPAEVSTLGAEFLREHIKTKKKEWTAKEINPLYQQESRAHKERIRQFEDLLDQPEALVAYVRHLHDIRAEKRVDQEQEIRRLVAVATATSRNEITPRQRDLIKSEAKGQRIPESVVTAVLQTMGVVVKAGKANATAKPAMPRMAPAMDRVILTEIDNWLRVLDKVSLYALLELPERSPPARVVSTAKLLFAKWSKMLPKTTECTAWEKLLQSAITYLKDDEGKARYDRALFNQRIDRFLQRIDLVLAGPAVRRQEQVFLTRLGVEDFGLSEQLAQECIVARAADKGISIDKPALVTVQLQGQIQCRICYAWNDAQLHKNCRMCGASLNRKCENPACKLVLPANARVCPQCRLPLVKGRRYAGLLELADVFLQRGNIQGATDACGMARQILSGPEVERRLARIQKMQTLIAGIRSDVSKKAWSKALGEIQQLMDLAPQFRQPGIPRLEEVVNYLASAREKLRALPADADPAEVARVNLVWLGQWTDCEEAYNRLRQLCYTLESKQRYRNASQVARKLLEVRPNDNDLVLLVEELDVKMKQAETQRIEVEEAHKAFADALAEFRLYAAEKALLRIEQLSGSDSAPDGADELRHSLTEIRAEIQRIKQREGIESERDPLILAYNAILEHCPDCREALAALQNLPPDPPQAPCNLSVQVEGPRRVVSWAQPESGKRPTRFVLQRSLSRPGTRAAESPFKSLYEGTDLHFVDDEIAHTGTLVRYAVHGVLCSRVEVAGAVLREFEVSSRPTPGVSALVWQEVLNLRCCPKPHGMQLSWFSPTGVRQVLVRRWVGGPEDHHVDSVTLAADGDGSFLDPGLEEGKCYTYRVSCLYDGPDGDFTTPGVVSTAKLPVPMDANGAPGSLEMMDAK